MNDGGASVTASVAQAFQIFPNSGQLLFRCFLEALAFDEPLLHQPT